MKKLIISLSFFALVLAGCTKADNDTPLSHRMTVIAGEATKTHLDSDEALWNQTDEKIKVLEIYNSDVRAAYTSDSGTTSDAGLTMSFGVEMTPATADRFYYYCEYPASAWVGSAGLDAQVTTASQQTPTATSFDGGSDVMFSAPDPTGYLEQPTCLSLAFTRVNAIGKMTLKNLPSDEDVKKVEISAVANGSSVVLAGTTTYQMATSLPVGSYGNVSAATQISLDYNGQGLKASGDGMTAYFLCYPFTLGDGGSFCVTVTTKSHIYQRIISTSEAKPLAFNIGEMSTFTVNMSSATDLYPKSAFFGLGYGGGNQGTATMVRVPIRHSYMFDYEWDDMPTVTMECLVKFQSGIPYQDTSSGNVLNTLMGMPNYFRMRLRDFYSEGSVPDPGTIRIQGLYPGGEITSQTNIVYDKWYHFALVFDNGTVSLYMDGVLQERNTASVATLNFLTSPGFEQDKYNDFFIGSCGGWMQSHFLNGNASECRLWSVARTAEQLKSGALYVDPASEGLVGYWKFNGSSAAEDLLDATANGFDADVLGDNTLTPLQPVEY